MGELTYSDNSLKYIAAVFIGFIGHLLLPIQAKFIPLTEIDNYRIVNLLICTAIILHWHFWLKKRFQKDFARD